ncbi:MAG: FAD-dependent oxidoreductase [Gammaproteobacteria bacterium]|nr:FAD-dependent oxidoreductase [Gammaproteobacteria bacterium]
MKSYDVIVIGAGIIGTSIAWQIARRSTLKVAVLEKGTGPGEGSSGASSAICRYRYTLNEMVSLARDGIDAYQNWQQFTELKQPRASFNNDGVLWMPGDDPDWANKEHRRLNGLGIATEVLDNNELAERFPAINSCTIVPDLIHGEDHICQGHTGNLLEKDAGYVDPVSAVQDLLEACKKNNVDVLFNTQANEIQVRGNRIQGLGLDGGQRISTPLIINASGPWCRQLFRAAGLDINWNLQPVRIQVIYRDRPVELKGHIPVTIDMGSGIYFRTQNRGQQLLVSSVREEDEREEVSDPDSYVTEHDAEFEHRTLHLLHHRLPALPYRGKIRGNCGLYTVNLDDVHPLVGPSEIDGFWLANGFSGHGFKLAPAIGSMVAQAITGVKTSYDTEIPISFFSIERNPISIADKSVLA